MPRDIPLADGPQPEADAVKRVPGDDDSLVVVPSLLGTLLAGRDWQAHYLRPAKLPHAIAMDAIELPVLGL